MTETTTRTTEEEITTLDGEIEGMERELAEDATAPLSWDEVTSTTAEEIAKEEQRRGVLPRLIQVAKVKRLELRIQRLEEEAEGLEAERAERHRALEKAKSADRKSVV